VTTAELLIFMREHPLAVQASVSAAEGAQAAVVGIVVTDDFEVFFDTAATSRKVDNLRRNPQIAFVIGGTTVGDERPCSTKASRTSPLALSLNG
jgi:general stress protein 26